MDRVIVMWPSVSSLHDGETVYFGLGHWSWRNGDIKHILRRKMSAAWVKHLFGTFNVSFRVFGTIIITCVVPVYRVDIASSSVDS